ncbi:MAG TPA: cysteine peptidase family C39 domain-containing protein [Chitinophagaceae bacterium]
MSTPLPTLKIFKERLAAFNIIIPELTSFLFENSWENFEKTLWIVADIALTFTAIGNITKLRYLRHLSRAARSLRLIGGSIELATSVVDLMLNFVNDCDGSGFCKKLKEHLFWISIATISVDIITERMLRKSAKETLDSAGDNISNEIKTHLKDISKGPVYGDSAFAYNKVLLQDYKTAFTLIGQSTDYTCLATSLKMVLNDHTINLTEELIAKALKTTPEGARLMDVSNALKKLRIFRKLKVKPLYNITLDALLSKLKKGDVAIVSIRIDDAYNHAMIVDKIADRKVYLRDPLPLTWGSSYSVSFDNFENSFNKQCIIFKSK